MYHFSANVNILLLYECMRAKVGIQYIQKRDDDPFQWETDSFDVVNFQCLEWFCKTPYVLPSIEPKMI